MTPKQFRKRALDLRNLAKGARNEADQAMLEDIAADLDAEARGLEAAKAAQPVPDDPQC